MTVAEPTDSMVLGRTAHVLVLRAAAADTQETLARRFLNDPGQAWRVTTLDGGPIRDGAIISMSLDGDDPGLAPAAQYVPILCYHRFSDGRSTSPMEVSKDAFTQQLQWLRNNGYTVVPLSQVSDFVNGRRVLPAKSVAITIDDGYLSGLKVAAPILKQYNDSATFFVYPDFVGAPSALGWRDIVELKHDPLFDVQSHSKTHTDMVKRLPNETPAAQARRRRTEVVTPLAVFGSHFSAAPGVFAYPFGSVDPKTIDEVKHGGYQAAVTVARGGNARWAPPYALRRDMIYGSDDITSFAHRLAAAEHGAVAGAMEVEK